MLNKTRPLYGSFNFGKDMDILVLIARMQQVSTRFLEDRIFNSYLKTTQGNSHYGLSYEELKSLFQVHLGAIHTITASSSTVNGKGVNINIRFAKGAETGDGQFVIVAGSQLENQEIRDMLLGNWEEREVEIQEEEIEEPMDLPEEEEAFSYSSPMPPERVINKKEYPLLKDAFYFQHELKPDELVDGIYDLFIRFMDDATFDIRLLSWTGDLHLGIKVEDLRKNLHQHHGQIQKLYVMLEAADGRQIDLILSFAPLPQEADSEIKIKTDNNKEILAFVKKQFALEEENAQARLLPFKMNFSYSPGHFQIEKLIFLVENIVRDQLPLAQATAFISNKGGVLYHDVTLDQLKDLFYLYQKNIHVLSLYISRAMTRQTVNLVYEFSSNSGSMALQTGVDSLQQSLSALIWDSLELKPFEPKDRKSEAYSENLPPSPLLIKPLFESKDIVFNPQLCLLILPDKPAPAEGMLAEMQRALEAAGLEVEAAEPIFGYLVMERLWQKLNAAGIVIADVTSKSAEVFYALGIAHTLGREVILLTQNPSDIPFDFKKYPHIIYEPNEAGYLNLRQELLAYLKKT